MHAGNQSYEFEIAIRTLDINFSGFPDIIDGIVDGKAVCPFDFFDGNGNFKLMMPVASQIPIYISVDFIL